MASTFTIKQEGKQDSIEVKWLVKNNAPTSSSYLQAFNFYFNYDKKIKIQGGGGLCPNGCTRNGSIYFLTKDDFPLTITSYEYNDGKITGMNYSVNLRPYNFIDYVQGRRLEITINSYRY